MLNLLPGRETASKKVILHISFSVAWLPSRRYLSFCSVLCAAGDQFVHRSFGEKQDLKQRRRLSSFLSQSTSLIIFSHFRLCSLNLGRHFFFPLFESWSNHCIVGGVRMTSLGAVMRRSLPPLCLSFPHVSENLPRYPFILLHARTRSKRGAICSPSRSDQKRFLTSLIISHVFVLYFTPVSKSCLPLRHITYLSDQEFLNANSICLFMLFCFFLSWL